MSQAIMISDKLYARLEATMRAHGLATIEQLLEEWQARENERTHRRQAVQQIDMLRERLFRPMANSLIALNCSVQIGRVSRWTASLSIAASRSSGFVEPYSPEARALLDAYQPGDYFKIPQYLP